MKKFLYIRWTEAYMFIVKSQMMFYVFTGQRAQAQALINEPAQWSMDRVRHRMKKHLKKAAQ